MYVYGVFFVYIFVKHCVLNVMHKLSLLMSVCFSFNKIVCFVGCWIIFTSLLYAVLLLKNNIINTFLITMEDKDPKIATTFTHYLYVNCYFYQ